MLNQDFLKQMGSDAPQGNGGSTFNGMSAEQVSAMADEEVLQQAEDTNEQFVSPQQSAPPPGYAHTNRYSAADPTATQNPSAAQTGVFNEYSGSTYAYEPFVPARERRQAVMDSNENVLCGTIGAFIGSVLGIAVWALIGMAGYISWLGALALVAGAFFGYILFAKNIGRAGALVVALLIIVSVYIGTRLSFAMILHNEIKDYNSTVTEAAEMIDDISVKEIFMDANYYIDLLDVRTEYDQDLGMGYFFTAICCISFFVNRHKKGLL